MNVSMSPVPGKIPFVAHFDEVEIGPKQTVFVRHRFDDEWEKVSIFKGQTFKAHESTQGATGVTFFFVGTKMQMPLPESIEGVPTMFFNGRGSDVSFDTCDGALFMTAVVTNASDEPVKWNATLDGAAVLKA
jgi:hypothetical protein